MVEIALSLGVIAFALVAIIGVLPTGMKVQRDNREETIINQDAVYWIEAIRSGAKNQNRNLYTYIDMLVSPSAPYAFSNDYDVVGILSAPGIKTNWIRSMSGSFAEKGNTNLTFSYRLIVDVVTNQPTAGSTELRLVFQWPLLPGGNTGSGLRTFRTIVGGKLDDTGGGYFFFQPNQF